MPPARTIHVDTDRILQNIAAQQAAQETDARDRCRGLMDADRMLADLLREAAWVPRKLPILAGRFLTQSERKRHQEALRRLEADGLVDLCTVWVRLTPKGQEYVAGLQGGAPSDA